MPRGGKREGAGRKRVKPECPTVEGNKDFSTRVLARIGKEGWENFADIRKVKSDEDFALHLLTGAGKQDLFHKLLDRKYGKAVQTLAHEGGDPKKPVEVNVTDSHGSTERLLQLLSRANSRRLGISQP